MFCAGFVSVLAGVDDGFCFKADLSGLDAGLDSSSSSSSSSSYGEIKVIGIRFTCGKGSKELTSSSSSLSADGLVYKGICLLRKENRD